MAKEQYDTDNGADLLHMLVKSPKQVKTRLRQKLISNSVIAHAYTFIDNTAEAVIFSQVSFCQSMAFIATANNKIVIFEDCNLHGKVNFFGANPISVIFRNCRMREMPQNGRSGNAVIETVDCQMLSAGNNYTSFIYKLPLQDPSSCN